MTVTEGGSPRQYQLALNSQPTAAVRMVVRPASSRIDIGNGAGQPLNVDFATTHVERGAHGHRHGRQ